MRTGYLVTESRKVDGSGEGEEKGAESKAPESATEQGFSSARIRVRSHGHSRSRPGEESDTLGDAVDGKEDEDE